MYILTFDDNTKFTSLDLRDSKWNEIPSKEIVKWEYSLFNKSWVLSGYESYNHLVEKVFVGGREKTTRVFLMASNKLFVDMVVFDIKGNRMYRDNSKLNQEYDGKPTTGWKKGKKTAYPRIQYLGK